jgi:hypothetical protein
MSASKNKPEPEPRTWVTLKHPSTKDDEGTATAFCSFVEKFLWRPNDGQQELFVVINNAGDRKRYKYKQVPKDTFEKAWERAHNPNHYNDNFGSWFSRAIKDNYSYDRFE